MTTRDETDTPAAGAVSRREFFAGAGMTAGALAALGSIGGTAYTPAAQAAAIKDRRYYSNYVSLELDGQYAGNLLSAEGGEPVLNPGQASDFSESRTATTVSYEPLKMRLGDMSASVFKWVGDASNGAVTSRQAAVITYDFDGREIYRLAMQGVRPAAITADSFDASTRDLLRFDLTLQPGQSAHVLTGKTINPGVKTGLKSKGLLRSNFRLYIQGYESAAPTVRNIDPVGLKARPDGRLVPTSLKFAMMFKDAAPMFAWMNETLAGKAGPRSAELQMLSADLTKVSAKITFEQLSIVRMSCPAQAVATEGVQLVEVECIPMALKFDMGDLLT